jgi:signal transduction histidine kinase
MPVILSINHGGDNEAFTDDMVIIRTINFNTILTIMSGSNDDFCQVLVVKSKALSLILFIALALVLEFVVHYVLKISAAYTHLFYLIIIFAAIWYQRKAVWVALFFGILHIVVTFLVLGFVSPDSVFRAIMLCIIAYIVGSLVQCMTHFREEDIREKRELEKAQIAFQTANKKLNILSSITRHDILNQLTALLGYQEIAQEICDDPDLMEIMKKEQNAADAIRKQIEFTRHYQDIGVRAPVWHNLVEILQKIQSDFHHDTISLQSTLINIEIYADPLFPLICQNLIDNSIRHGERVNSILFSSEQTEKDLILIYQDDGIGVPDSDKEKIFKQGFGKHTGMGLFLSQEILAITGLAMRETGVLGKGARFEIHIPEGSFRVGPSVN